MTNWRRIQRSGLSITSRQEVPTGWLVKVEDEEGVGLTFVPDPEHEWSPTPATNNDQPTYGPHLRLVEITDGGNGSGPVERDIVLNRTAITIVRPVTQGDGAPRGALTTVIVGGEEVFLPLSLTSVLERLQRRDLGNVRYP